MDQLTSNLYGLDQIIQEDLRFNIPRYQRLFVWEEEQVKTLFYDIFTAAMSEKEFYYLGGVIIVNYPKLERCYDLVDGQQRFTTLWLLANELGQAMKDFTVSNNHLRLNFSIREQVEAYFRHLRSNVDVIGEKEEFEDLVRIDKAGRTLRFLINENLKTEEKKSRFIDFLRNRVKMVMTEVPPVTDLNKLFETLNNRGEQLAQHEILKARLLAKIKSHKKRYRYSILWNACSDMNNYFERALAYEIGSAKDVANTYDGWKHDWVWVPKIIRQENSSGNQLLSLKEIIKKGGNFRENSNGFMDEGRLFHPEANDDEFENVRSILTFPQLLLHVLRIYLYWNGDEDLQRINEKELLSVFSKRLFHKRFGNDEEQIKNEQKESLNFLDLLFEVREVFDKYIIKWVEENPGEETHLIKKIRKQNQKKGGRTYYLRREKTNQYDGLALLQSILYHSQQNTTQYWLTPFLNWMLDHPSFEDAFTYLKVLDNILFSSDQEHRLLTERTWECMTDYPEISPTTEVLEYDLGTNYPHYWFYKMEFVLWHERNEFGKTTEWEKYKMTAKNSIEHISPQNPRDMRDKLCSEYLHKFGNLVLVTRSINSEYSDLPYKVKKAKYLDKRGKGAYDSLKSDLIYEHETWNDHFAKQHQKKMIELMQSYFDKTMPNE